MTKDFKNAILDTFVLNFESEKKERKYKLKESLIEDELADIAANYNQSKDIGKRKNKTRENANVEFWSNQTTRNKTRLSHLYEDSKGKQAIRKDVFKELRYVNEVFFKFFDYTSHEAEETLKTEFKKHSFLIDPLQFDESSEENANTLGSVKSSIKTCIENYYDSWKKTGYSHVFICMARKK